MIKNFIVYNTTAQGKKIRNLSAKSSYKDKTNNKAIKHILQHQRSRLENKWMCMCELFIHPIFRYCQSHQEPCNSTGWYILVFLMETSRIQIPPSTTIELSKKKKIFSITCWGFQRKIYRKAQNTVQASNTSYQVRN